MKQPAQDPTALPPVSRSDAAAFLFAVQDDTMLAWVGDAACQDSDTDLFFPIGPEGPGRLQAERAKAVCRTCTVRRQCADWAINTAQQYGIWGGMDEVELDVARRRASRSRRTASQCRAIAVPLTEEWSPPQHE
jgi:WhiB family redox-sensing transcriptional regulator